MNTINIFQLVPLFNLFIFVLKLFQEFLIVFAAICRWLRSFSNFASHIPANNHQDQQKHSGGANPMHFEACKLEGEISEH
jgi:hypothetical protein